MITAAQLRAARGLLDWTRSELAKVANISPETVKNIEHGTFRPQETTADAIIKAFAAHDVEFIENDGVRKNRELIKTFVGASGYNQFLDDICSTMRGGGKTSQFNFSDKIISTYGGERIESYNKFMQSVPSLEARCLVPDGDVNTPVKHCQYRWLKKIHQNAVPYYLYGNKIAMLTTGVDDEMAWVIICSDYLANAFLKQFESYWETAESVPEKR